MHCAKYVKKMKDFYICFYIVMKDGRFFFKILKSLINQLREKEDIPNWNELLIMGLNEKCTNKEVINLCISMGKYVIWKRRNIVRSKDCKIDMEIFKKENRRIFANVICVL